MSDLDLNSLALPWLNPGDTPFWFAKSSWSLAAILQAWRIKNGKVQPEVWIPSYFCNQSLWPVMQSQIRIRFYPVNLIFQPIWEKCQEMLQIGQPDIFLVAHFFGFESDVKKARSFCEALKALLVEDCAHVLKPTGDIGKQGDFVFYSPHKHLPIPDGSLLLVSARAKDYSAIMNDAKSFLGTLAPRSSIWLGKRMIQKLIPQRPLYRLKELRSPLPFLFHPDATPMNPNPELSKMSRKLLLGLLPELDKISSARIENKKALFRALNGFSGWQGLADTPEFYGQSNPRETKNIPYSAVFRCDTPELAEKRFVKIRRQGLVVQTWPDLPPAVLGSPELYPHTFHLRNTQLIIPIHQSLKPRELYHLYEKCLN